MSYGLSVRQRTKIEQHSIRRRGFELIARQIADAL